MQFDDAKYEKAGGVNIHILSACTPCSTRHSKKAIFMFWKTFATEWRQNEDFRAHIHKAESGDCVSSGVVNDVVSTEVVLKTSALALTEEHVLKATGRTRLPKNMKSIPMIGLPVDPLVDPAETYALSEDKRYLYKDPLRPYPTVEIAQRISVTLNREAFNAPEQWAGQAAGHYNSRLASLLTEDNARASLLKKVMKLQDIEEYKKSKLPKLKHSASGTGEQHAQDHVSGDNAPTPARSVRLRSKQNEAGEEAEDADDGDIESDGEEDDEDEDDEDCDVVVESVGVTSRPNTPRRSATSFRSPAASDPPASFGLKSDLKEWKKNHRQAEDAGSNTLAGTLDPRRSEPMDDAVSISGCTLTGAGMLRAVKPPLDARTCASGSVDDDEDGEVPEDDGKLAGAPLANAKMRKLPILVCVSVIKKGGWLKSITAAERAAEKLESDPETASLALPLNEHIGLFKIARRVNFAIISSAVDEERLMEDGDRIIVVILIWPQVCCLAFLKRRFLKASAGTIDATFLAVLNTACPWSSRAPRNFNHRFPDLTDVTGGDEKLFVAWFVDSVIKTLLVPKIMKDQPARDQVMAIGKALGDISDDVVPSELPFLTAVLVVQVQEISGAIFYSFRDTPPAHQWQAACMRYVIWLIASTPARG